LEGADGAEEEQLKREPLAGADTVEGHVRRDLEEHDAERKHLLAHVELILSDADILEEVVCESIRDVATIELFVSVRSPRALSPDVPAGRRSRV
jgi:hypothetical protein